MDQWQMTDELIVFTVSEVSFHLKQVIETQIEPLYVRGEISNYTHHSSGHIYFNLCDANATLRCTFFRHVNLHLDFRPEDGMEVTCFGKLTVFEKGGTYNLNVQSMFKSGQGDLSRQFELLKKKLDQEGLFAAEHKQSLPRYPQRIGIITSPTGAALQDIVNILTRRYPVEVDVYPAQVQGAEAPAQLISGLRYFNEAANVEVIILTRGGGSQEDLFCFNDEALARAVFASRIPVISAVGHEIDFSISDFVADLRAPTPSAAAELVVPDKKELLSYLESVQRRMGLGISHQVKGLRNSVAELELVLNRRHPQHLWQNLQQRFDLAVLALQNSSRLLQPLRHRFELDKTALLNALNLNYQRVLANSKHRMADQELKLKQTLQNSLREQQIRCEGLQRQLEQLSPKQILAKGYSILKRQGKMLGSVQQLHPDESLELQMKDGSAGIRVETVTPDQRLDG